MVKSKKDVFFDKMDVLGLALTFDEVILKTGYAEVMPDDVSIESRFSRNIPLKNPLVSAAMDRVTEEPMAIALGKLGGLGVDATDALIVKHVGGLRPLEESPVLVVVAEP